MPIIKHAYEIAAKRKSSNDSGSKRLFGDFLFIYMKRKNLEKKQANYILNYIYKKKENTRGHSISFH